MAMQHKDNVKPYQQDQHLNHDLILMLVASRTITY